MGHASFRYAEKGTTGQVGRDPIKGRDPVQCTNMGRILENRAP